MLTFFSIMYLTLARAVSCLSSRSVDHRTRNRHVLCSVKEGKLAHPFIELSVQVNRLIVRANYGANWPSGETIDYQWNNVFQQTLYKRTTSRAISGGFRHWAKGGKRFCFAFPAGFSSLWFFLFLPKINKGGPPSYHLIFISEFTEFLHSWRFSGNLFFST